MGVEQNSPISTPGVAKRAEVEATARSQLATSWQPAAVAMPCTWAITGLGWRTMACIIVRALGEQGGIGGARPRRHRRGARASSFRSWPEEKTGPSAAITITRVALSAAAPSSAACSAAISSDDRALRALGRLRISRSTPPVWADSSRGGAAGAFMQRNVVRAHWAGTMPS